MDNVKDTLNITYIKILGGLRIFSETISKEWANLDTENEEQCQRIEKLTEIRDKIDKALDMMTEYL